MRTLDCRRPPHRDGRGVQGIDALTNPALLPAPADVKVRRLIPYRPRISMIRRGLPRRMEPWGRTSTMRLSLSLKLRKTKNALAPMRHQATLIISFAWKRCVSQRRLPMATIAHVLRPRPVKMTRLRWARLWSDLGRDRSAWLTIDARGVRYGCLGIATSRHSLNN